ILYKDLDFRKEPYGNYSQFETLFNVEVVGDEKTKIKYNNCGNTSFVSNAKGNNLEYEYNDSTVRMIIASRGGKTFEGLATFKNCDIDLKTLVKGQNPITIGSSFPDSFRLISCNIKPYQTDGLTTIKNQITNSATFRRNGKGAFINCFIDERLIENEADYVDIMGASGYLNSLPNGFLIRSYNGTEYHLRVSGT